MFSELMFHSLREILRHAVVANALPLFDSPGLDVATCGVANATSFYSVATKFSPLVANLATKIGDFLLWVNVH